MIEPYFDYCSPLWGNCSAYLKEKLQRFQSRAARSRILLPMQIMKLLRLSFLILLDGKRKRRRNRNKSILMYRILNNQTEPNLKELFTKVDEPQANNNLRNSCTDLALPKPRRGFLKKGFKYSGAKIWNSLPIEGKVNHIRKPI